MSQFNQAREYVNGEYSVIPCRQNGKEPALASWNEYRDRLPFEDEIASWFQGKRRVPFNTGVLTEGLGIYDFDDKQKGREFYKEHGKNAFKTIVETRRGVHFAFQAPGGLPSQKLEDGDFKANGGFVIWPWSHIIDKTSQEQWDYRFVEGHPLVPKAELPVIDLNWLDDLKPVVPQRTTVQRGVIRDAIAYVMKVESIQGEHGSNGLVRAISILRDAGMTEAEATVVICNEWNPKMACPPWEVKQLTRAISRTYAKGKA